MYRCQRRYHEGDQKMEGKKTSQGGVIYRETSSQPHNQIGSEIWKGGEKIGDDCGPPEPYLPSWKYIPQESGRHHPDQREDAGRPRLPVYVTAIIKASPHVAV